MVHHAGKRFSCRGYYGNDCPYCNTHNAIIEHYVSGLGLVYQCRDRCKTWFKLVCDKPLLTNPAAGREWEEIDPPKES
jgi:hypothetical protein